MTTRNYTLMNTSAEYGEDALRTRAACAGHPDPDLWFPFGPLVSIAQAQAICGQCPVAQLCLTTGVERREDGVWGGVLLEGGRPARAAAAGAVRVA